MSDLGTVPPARPADDGNLLVPVGTALLGLPRAGSGLLALLLRRRRDSAA